MCGFCGFEMGNCIFPISTSIHGFVQNFPVLFSFSTSKQIFKSPKILLGLCPTFLAKTWGDGQGLQKIENWGAHIHTFVFIDCKNDFQKKLMMHNTNT